MADSSGAATALATLGTICWCIQLIPQVVRNWYVRDCEGVPPSMFFLFAASGFPFAIYFVVQNSNTALMVQPHLFMFFSLIGYWQSLYYPPVASSFRKSCAYLFLLVAIGVGAEVGCIVPLRKLYEDGTEWPNLIPGIVAAVLLAVGLLPPYWELIKRKGCVLGINFLFLTLDSSGAIFSAISVGLEPGKIDVLGLVLYLIVLVLEYGIMISHFVWVVRVRYGGLSTADEAAVAEWEQTKREKLRPPKSEKLREFVRSNVVVPVGHSVLRLRQRFRKYNATSEVQSECCSAKGVSVEP